MGMLNGQVMLQSNLQQIKGAVSDLKNEIHLASFLVLSSPQTEAAPHTQRQESRWGKDNTLLEANRCFSWQQNNLCNKCFKNKSKFSLF